jgi:sensor histidine kinase regulating citrate/malate metabolism
MPQMPYLSLWEKITFFIAFPIFLAVAGAFVGFLIGVMLDTLERQIEQKEMTRSETLQSRDSERLEIANTQKMSVWVEVGDLEENQRVAETVTGEDGTPILLRHTLLKPSHIQMLKDQNVDRIKIDLVKHPVSADLAFAG